MPFDPDKYLESKEVEFNPDTYLKKKGDSKTTLEVGSEDVSPDGELPTQDQGSPLSGFRTIHKKGDASFPSGVTVEKTPIQTINFEQEDAQIEAQQTKQRELAQLNVKDKYKAIKPQIEEFRGIISQQKSDIDAEFNYTKQTLDELKRADQLDLSAPDVVELTQNYDRLYKENIEKDKQVKNIENAELFVKDLENIINGKNKKFSEGVYQSTVKKLAFDGIAEIKRNFNLKEISDKISKGEDITADEQLAIASYGLLNEAQSNFQSGIGYDVGSGLVEMVPYLFSFAVSGGASKGIQAGVMSALKSTGEKTTKELVKKGIAYITGQLVRPAFFSSLYSSGIEKQIGQVETTNDLLPSIAEGTKESPQKAFTKAYANTLSEVLTEQLGEVAVPMFNKIIGKEVKQALNPTLIDKIKDVTAFNGFLPEMGEEFANQVATTAIEGRPAEEIFDPRTILTTALTVGIMSGGFALSNKAYKLAINQKEQESGFKFDTKTKKQVDDIIESDKTTEEKAKDLSYIIDNKVKSGAKEEEISNIVQYATSHMAKTKLDEVEPEIEKASQKKAQDEVKPKSEGKVPPEVKTVEKLNELGGNVALDKPMRNDFEDGVNGDQKFTDATKSHNDKIDAAINGINQNGIIISRDGRTFKVEIGFYGPTITETFNGEMSNNTIYRTGKRVDKQVPFTNGFKFKPDKVKPIEKPIEEKPVEEELPPNVIKTEDGIFELNEDQQLQREEMTKKYGKERADELIVDFIDANDLKKYEYLPEDYQKSKSEGSLPKEEPKVESKKITRTIKTPDSDLSNTELIQRLKAENPGKKTNELYGLFVKARDLKPDIDAKKFNEIFNSVSPNMHTKEETLNFDATHYDKTKEMYVQNIQEEGYVKHVWEDGSTGSTPNKFIDKERFTNTKPKITEEPINAESIREDQGQNDQGGIIPPESEGKSSENLQQPQEAGSITGNEKAGLTSKEEVPIEQSPVTKKPDKNASIKEEKLLKEQKAKLIDDIKAIEDILLGENKENARKFEKDALGDGTKSDNVDGIVEGSYEYNATNLTPKIEKQLNELGVKVVDGKFVIDIYKDGSASFQSVRMALRAVEKNFPASIPKKGMGSGVPSQKSFGKPSKTKLQQRAEDYGSMEEADNRLKIAEQNNSQAQSKGTEGMKKVWKEALEEEKQVHDLAKDINYEKLAKEKSMDNDAELNDFYKKNGKELDYNNIDREDIYDVTEKYGRPDKLTMDEVMPLILKDKLIKDKKTYKEAVSELKTKLSDEKLEQRQKYMRQDGTALRKPKNNNEEWEMRNNANRINRLENEIADFEKYKKQLTEEVSPKNKEQKIKEAGGQSVMEEESFAQQSKGKKKPPPSKEKGIQKPVNPSEKETKKEPTKRWIDEEQVTNEGLKGIEVPELIKMIIKLSGKYPALKNFQKKLGVFYHSEAGDSSIALHRKLFTKEGINMLGKVIAHEFGHFIDFLPDGTLKRGNILGRIASLKEYFAKTLGEKPGTEDTVLTEKDRVLLRKEAERSLKEEYDKGIRDIIEEVIKEEPIFEESGLTTEDILGIWNDNQARENNPELYEYIAKLSSYQKKKIVSDALKGLIDTEVLRKFSKGKQVGVKITKEFIKKTVAPKPVDSISIREKYRELLKQEINKRRLFESEVIRKELEALTKWWNPYNESDDSSYTEYRKSGKEIYAEALSVLLNNPQALAERAPFFNRAFFNYFPNKPNVKQVYDEVQELISKPKEVLQQDRLNRVYEGFKKAEAKRQDIAKQEKTPKLTGWNKMLKDYVSLIIPIIRKIPEPRKLTMELNDRQVLRDYLEKLAFANEKVAVMLVDMEKNINQELKEVGLSVDDFSALLEVERNISQRTDIANPYAFQEIASSELKAFIESKFSGEQKDTMDRVKQTFHNKVFDIMENAYKAGMFTPEQYDYISKFKDSYATFQVVDYIDKNSVSAGFKKATGTLKEVESPYISTLFKVASVIKGIERQNAVNAFINAYEQYLPGEIKESEHRRINGISTGFKTVTDKGRIEYWKDGKWSGLDVDPYIAEFFEMNKSSDLGQLVTLFHYFNKGFKPLVTTWNVGWAFFSNIFRDHPRTFYNTFAILASTEGMSKVNALKLPATYLKSLINIFPDAKKFVQGELTPLIEDMINEGVLRHGFFGSYDPHAEESIGPVFQAAGMIKKDQSIRDKMAERSRILKFGLKILGGIEFAGQVLEVSSKMTAFNLLQQNLADAKAAGFYTRNYAGTPNYLEKGTHTSTTNEIFTFSNVILQSIRTDSEIAFKPQTRGAYWTAQAISVVTPAALMALAAAGLFGDELEDLYGQLTEYEKTNFLCIIWGSTSAGKPVYTKLPIPEFSRVTHGITYKTMAALLGGEGINKPEQLLALGSSLTPSPSPLIKTSMGWSQYIANKNPYDFFYGNNVLTDREQDARGWPALKKMITWSVKNMGGGFITKFYDYDPTKNSTTEYILKNTPLVGRVIKIGGYGQSETLSGIGDKVRSEKAKESLELDKIINRYVIQALSEGKDMSNSSDIINNMKKEIYSGDIVTSDQRKEFSYTKKKFKTKLLKGIKGPFSNAVSSIIDSKSNDEKTAKLQQYALIHGEDKFIELISYLNSQELISDQLRSKVSAMVKDINLDEMKRNEIINALNNSGVDLDTFEGEEIPQ